jgi:hypothetical protein
MTTQVDCRIVARFSFLIPLWISASAFSEWRVICSEPMTFPKSSVDPVGIGFWFYLHTGLVIV